MNQNTNQKQNNLLWFGTIVNTHGLKGEVRVLTNSDNVENIKKDTLFYLENDEQLIVSESRRHKNFLLLKFKNLNSINDVEKFKNSKLFISRDDLDKNEFYYSDLIDFNAIDLEKNNFGKIINFFDQKAYYSYEIKTIEGRSINIPILDEFIQDIDYEKEEVYFKVGQEFWRKEK